MNITEEHITGTETSKVWQTRDGWPVRIYAGGQAVHGAYQNEWGVWQIVWWDNATLECGHNRHPKYDLIPVRQYDPNEAIPDRGKHGGSLINVIARYEDGSDIDVTNCVTVTRVGEKS
jgi:hypothetical protein